MNTGRQTNEHIQKHNFLVEVITGTFTSLIQETEIVPDSLLISASTA